MHKTPFVFSLKTNPSLVQQTGIRIMYNIYKICVLNSDHRKTKQMVIIWVKFFFLNMIKKKIFHVNIITFA